MVKAIYYLSLLLFLTNCKTQTEPVDVYFPFPNSYQELGLDSEHSFISLRTESDVNRNLSVTIEGWSIKEEGIYLDTKYRNRILLLRTRAMCGTVTSRTWEKFKFTYVVPDTVRISLQNIEYRHGPLTLTVARH